MNRLRPVHLSACAGMLLAVTLFTQLSSAQSSVDRQCLSCHKDPSLRQTTADGRTRSLHVDPKNWTSDIHREKGFTCIDCHAGAKPSSHPVSGLGTPSCDDCHAEACEELARTIHVVPNGTKPVPSCHDCHTEHAVRRKDDPESSVSAKKIVSTCSPCHPSESTTMSWLDRLVFFRLDGHKKEDISGQYDRSRCIDCHFRDGAHGQPGVLSERCASCHGKQSGEAKIFSRSVHAASLLGGSGGVAGVRFLYVLLMAAVVGSFLYRKVWRGRRGQKEENH